MSSTSAPLPTATTSGIAEQRSSGNMTEADTPKHSPPKPQSSKHDYKGFVAGVFSGIAKLSVRKEGVSGLYKGATPPLVGWMVMDSV
ncbi:hypothetical protein AtubIFM61612_003357 [Aspergillus tubingensis]|nr:hypothetical protein AtubIFM61612_003357 [Aspergillus tubingensis]